MNIPSPSDQRWVDLISGNLTHDKFEYLATKIIIGRLVVNYKLSPTKEIMDECIEDLINFFRQNARIPKVQADLAKILS